MNTVLEPSRSWVRTWLVVAAVWVAHGMLLFGYRHLDHLAHSDETPWLVPFLEESTGIVFGLLIFIPFPAFVRRFPLRRGTVLRNAPVHLVVMVAASFLHTWMLAHSRAALFPAFGLGDYDYGDMAVRYWMELANDAASYAILLMLVIGYGAVKHARAQELSQAELRAELARAQVQSLEKQLHPHFLFNALNTIASVMYEDPATADQMIAGLSNLLRRALQTSDAQEVPLSDEVALVDHYVQIMQARFAHQLEIEIDVDPEVRLALVPPLLLQPLVENAIRHGADATHHVRAALRIRRDGNWLRLEVRDHGGGLAGVVMNRGVGISVTARRLSALYGASHRLDFEDAVDGGLRVTVELPFHTA